MTPITKAQRRAILRIFRAYHPLQSGKTAQALARDAGWKFAYDADGSHSCWWNAAHPHQAFSDALEIVDAFKLDHRVSYRNFRKTVQRGYDCLMVHVSGIWIGIESDGYSHT